MAFTRNTMARLFPPPPLPPEPPDPLDPANFGDEKEWMEAMLAARLPTDEIKRRRRAEDRVQARLRQEAERAEREADMRDRWRDNYRAAAERILREEGRDPDYEPEPQPVVVPSEEFAAGRWV